MSVIEKGTQMLGISVDDLPITSRINVGGTLYVRKPNGKWTSTEARQNYTRAEFVNDSYTVTVDFVPYPVDNPETEIPDFVLRSWRGQFINAVRYGARDHGVGASLVNEAFADIGLSDADENFEWQPGMGGARGAVYALRDLPSGSLIYSGGKVWEKRAAYFYQRAPKVDQTARNLGDRPWVVMRVGEDGDLAPIEFRMSDEDRLVERQLRSRAWQVGMRLKTQHGWCSALESIMQAGGLTPADAISPGLKRTEVRSLPEGSLVFWQHSSRPREWAVLRRDDTARNTAHTTFWFGTETSTSHPRMTPVWVSSRPWEGIPAWEVPNIQDAATVLLTLPLGSVVTIAHNFYRVDALTSGATRFGRINARSGDRLYRSASRAETHGHYGADAFGTGATVVSIPFIPEENR